MTLLCKVTIVNRRMNNSSIVFHSIRYVPNVVGVT